MSYTFDRYLNIRSALSPIFSPDGKRIAFLTDISGNFQVWSVGAEADNENGPMPSAEAGWPLQLTYFTDKVWEIHGTAAAPHLIAVSDVGGNERQQFYLISNYGVGTNDTVGHDIRRLSVDDDAIHRFGAWSADGNAIIYTSNARNGVDFDLYWMDVLSGERRLVAETSGNRAVVAWSPNGSTALMLDSLASEQHELYLVDLTGGEERHLTADQPWARYAAVTWTKGGIFALSDREDDRLALCRLDTDSGDLITIVSGEELLAAANTGDGELESFVIAPDGQTAVCALNVEGYSRLFCVQLNDGDPNEKRWRALDSLPSGLIISMHFSADSRQLVFDLQNPQHNPDIWTLDLANGSVRRLTFSNRAGIDAATFVAPELVHFTSFDEMSVPAFFYRPQQPAPTGGYPCILYVHGGPASQQRPDFDVRFQYFLGQGYAILATNVRGSTGYGRRSMMLDDVEKRMDSVVDLKHAVLWLHDQPDVDNQRIAIYGRSYGGFMVLAALTEYPELFAAGIDVVGIADWVTFLERTSSWRRAHREREYGSLANHRELLADISPIHKAERIQMPLMVLAGDNDPRVPLNESEQIVARVMEAGGTVEFIHYADEGHRFSKLANRIDSFTRMAAFLETNM